MTGKRTVRARVAQAGQTLPLVVVFMFTILIFAGLVIDLGNAYRVQQALQASADASAAGGAGELTVTYPPIAANATAAAVKYGSQSGGENPITGVPAANVTQTVTVDCPKQEGFNCTSGEPNTVTVDETAKVPTYLLKLLGSGSMSANNKLPKAKAWIMAFLNTMDPTVDNVGLAVLPPAPSTAAACTDVDPYFNGDSSGTYSLANPPTRSCPYRIPTPAPSAS
jgi:hypothetical protein